MVKTVSGTDLISQPKAQTIQKTAEPVRLRRTRSLSSVAADATPASAINSHTEASGRGKLNKRERRGLETPRGFPTSAPVRIKSVVVVLGALDIFFDLLASHSTNIKLSERCHAVLLDEVVAQPDSQE